MDNTHSLYMHACMPPHWLSFVNFLGMFNWMSLSSLCASLDSSWNLQLHGARAYVQLFLSFIFSRGVSLLEKVKLKKFDSVNWNYFNFQQSSLLRRRSGVDRAIVQRTTCATHSNGDEVARNIFLLLFFRVSFFSLIFTLCTYLKRKFPHSKLLYYPQSDIGFSISRTVIVTFTSRVKWLICIFSLTLF